MKTFFSHVIGYSLMIFPIIGYGWVLYRGFIWFIQPLIQLYGFWTWLGYIVVLSLTAFLCGLVGTWAWATAFLTNQPPAKPQATYKETISE